MSHMKYLTIVIPSYNSERFILNCLNSLCIGKDELLDVIVINDGSTDRTSELAHEFAKSHSFVRVVDKPNGGHGSGINKGLELAEGLYFKVLDSDDFLDKEGFIYLLDTIERHYKADTLPDLYLADYVSRPEGTDIKQYITLKHRIKEAESFIGWHDFKHLSKTEFIMIHMTFPKTALLRNTNMNLIEKTFYEDNEFSFHLIKYAKSVFYLEKPIYLYTVGRDGQSISLESVNKNYPHQFRVMKRIIDEIPYKYYKTMDKGRKKAIKHALFIYSVVTYFYTYIAPNKDKRLAYKDYLKYFRKTNPKMYKVVRYATPTYYLWLCPPFIRGWATKIGYNAVGRKEGWK